MRVFYNCQGSLQIRLRDAVMRIGTAEHSQLLASTSRSIGICAYGTEGVAQQSQPGKGGLQSCLVLLEFVN